MEEEQDVSKTLNFVGQGTEASNSTAAPKRKAQIVKSDALFLYLAQVIDANLKDEESSEGPPSNKHCGSKK